MLVELKVSHFAIIDNVHIQFGPGLNILSGETGAGKSVLLRSLSLLMGEKAPSDSVRAGHQDAVIEGLFDLRKRPDTLKILNDMGIDTSEDSLVVRRVITAQGKGRVYLNGSLSALNTLREVVAPLIEVTGQAAPLIEMTGQHDSKHLLSRAYHLDLLDHYAGCWKLRGQYHDKYERFLALDDEIAKLKEETRSREQRLDFLTYQRDEIRALNLSPGEEEQLESQVGRLKNAARFVDFVSLAEAALYSDDDSALVRLHSVMQKGQELTRFDSSLSNQLETLSQAKTLIEDTVYELREYGKNISGDADELNRAQERLSQLRRLQKKHGASVAEILETLKDIEEEILRLESSDETLKGLEKEKAFLKNELELMAKDLHKRRTSAATLLTDGVNGELEDLNMKGVQFHVQVSKSESFGPAGASDVEFMIRNSKSENFHPLAKFASGGELSRILLSLKRIIGHSEFPRCYLFDEVDAGVSGPTAEKVGRKLKSIAQGQQVICVTHLPQVACFGDQHFLISKSPTKKGVQMEVRPLKKSERIEEIARLISGEKITKTSLDHAKQLLSL